MKKTDQSALVTNEKWPFQIPCYPTMGEPGPSREGCGGGDVHVSTELLEFSSILTPTVAPDMAGIAPGQEDVVEGLRDLVGLGTLSKLLHPRKACVDV